MKSYICLEATILNLALVLHMKHSGGNNSIFTTRVTTSFGSDTYAVIAATMSSLKGPKYGSVNLKVMEMMENIKKHMKHPYNDGELGRCLEEILDKKVFDHQSLIYGTGHAVYTISDLKAEVFRSFVQKLVAEKGRQDDYEIYESMERLASEPILAKRPNTTSVSTNVEFYSGFVYNSLDISKGLYTALFTTARIVGWSAHRIEELVIPNNILRPAYISMMKPREYVPLEMRGDNSNKPEAHWPRHVRKSLQGEGHGQRPQGRPGPGP